MKMNKLYRIVTAIVILWTVASSGFVAAPVAALDLAAPNGQNTPDAPNENPDTMVPAGATDYTLAAPKLYWRDMADVCPPSAAQANATNSSEPAATQSHFETIDRVSIYGSSPRQLYSNDAYCVPSSIQSNIVADDKYIYFTNANGLVRLSSEANPGDEPKVVTTELAGSAQLAIDDQYIFALVPDNADGSELFKVQKSDGTTTDLAGGGDSPIPFSLSSSHSFNTGVPERYYVYWLQGGQLHRYNLLDGSLDNVATGVIAYYAEGQHTVCNFVFGCGNDDLIFLSFGHQIVTYDNRSGQLVLLYDSGGDEIYGLVTDQDNLYFLQEHDGSTCQGDPNCFRGPFTDYVIRRGRSDSGPTDPLFTSVGDNLTLPHAVQLLKTADVYLYFAVKGAVLRLPKNASILPLTNMRITGMEITQGIQRPDNSIRLIEKKRTFVRVYVKSDGPPIPGVTANLIGMSGDKLLGDLVPVNSIGTNLTVDPAPLQANINESFVFELPWGWTTSGPLTLRAELNPYHAPPQADYSGNSLTQGPFTFSPSPRLEMRLVEWGYVLNNKYYVPRLITDTIQTISWIRRVYPLASTPGFQDDSSPGFRPGLWFVGDDSLGGRVAQTDPSCKTMTDKSLCASTFTNQQMDAMRDENELGSNIFIYGMLSDAAGIFPRGQACCGTNVSTGPAGSTATVYTWDKDDSYADWYAGHEIGHTLGRGHPSKGNTTKDGCSTYDKGSSTDNSDPWDYAHIGKDDTTEGFDAGDPTFKIDKAVYPGTQWHDLMSYCDYQWISDYTYNGMYDYMIAHPTTQAATARVEGDLLSIYGMIFPASNTATINVLRHLSSAAQIPPITAGDYAIELVDGSNKVLASYPFTADAAGEGGGEMLTFGQIVQFKPGARAVHVTRRSDHKILVSAPISAHAPVVSNVKLINAQNPVTGTVRLQWDANDADGDTLQYDIFYSRDGGATVQPVRMHVTAKSAQIDTTMLGGGNALLRVIASDGFHTGQADSPAFVMAGKPPLVMIHTPGDGVHIHYGQLVNFSGEALDFQDDGVLPEGLVWSSQQGQLGTGPLLSIDNLLVGTNVITLRATNRLNLTAEAKVTVYVDDDLALLGPTLTVAPASLAWDFPKNPPTTESRTLDIGNAGSGTLTWTASVDVSWIKLSAVSGTSPATLTVTADPAGIANGKTRTGTLTVTTPGVGGSGAQTEKILLSIEIGVPFDNPNGYKPPTGQGGSHMYLFMPLVHQ